jgi:hypothetical protein
MQEDTVRGQKKEKKKKSFRSCGSSSSLKGWKQWLARGCMPVREERPFTELICIDESRRAVLATNNSVFIQTTLHTYVEKSHVFWRDQWLLQSIVS